MRVRGRLENWMHVPCWAGLSKCMDVGEGVRADCTSLTRFLIIATESNLLLSCVASGSKGGDFTRIRKGMGYTAPCTGMCAVSVGMCWERRVR